MIKKKFWLAEDVIFKSKESGALRLYELVVISTSWIFALWGHFILKFCNKCHVLIDYTGLQRNWGKHKNTPFYLIWGCWIQIWNPFLLITSSFLDMHSVHIRVYEFRVNSNIVRLMAYFLVIMH